MMKALAQMFAAFFKLFQAAERAADILDTAAKEGQHRTHHWHNQCEHSRQKEIEALRALDKLPQLEAPKD